MKKEITIESLTLNNFKGIKSLHVNFKNQTDIYGANGTGKTTIADAVNWLWFGKDSSDRKDFEIKTLDANGKTTPMTEHEVSAVYHIDGDVVTMRRTLKESWVKKKGNLESEFTGNETKLYWNEVPVTVTEFSNKVNAVLNEYVFKMITSPTFFNDETSSFGDAKKPAWYNRRRVLIDMVGEVSDEELAAGNPAYEALIANLTQGKTMDEYKLQIANSVKKAKDDLKAIPTRIDEVNKQKPEAQDFEALAIELSGFQKQLESIDGQLADTNLAFEGKLNEQKDLKININNVEVEIRNIESGARTEAKTRLTPDTSAQDKLNRLLQEKNHEVASYNNSVQTLEGQKGTLVSKIEATKVKIDAKRAEWETENAKELTFKDNDFHCPTCKREFESGDVEAKKAEMQATFKGYKRNNLNGISTEGQNLAAEKLNQENELAGLITRIENNKTSAATAQGEADKITEEIGKIQAVPVETQSEELVYESILSLHPTYNNKKSELQVLKGQLVEIPVVDNAELTSKRKTLVDNIDNIKGSLNLKTQIDNCDNRIKELKDQEQTLSQQIVDVEKIQFTIENFIKDKIDRFESAINGKFKMVKFKMFEEQINGGMRETCVAMVNGVPISDVNNAAKINAGIDIINTLCDFYGVTAPIIIDNRESVTDIIDTESQLISLHVAPYVLKIGQYSNEELAEMLKVYNENKELVA